VKTENEKVCAHAGCSCPAEPWRDYCSDQCQRALADEHGECLCDHEICRQNRHAAQQKAPPRGISGSYDPARLHEDAEKPLMDDWGKGDKH
jgi:hypothetical protein